MTDKAKLNRLFPREAIGSKTSARIDARGPARMNAVPKMALLA